VGQVNDGFPYPRRGAAAGGVGAAKKKGPAEKERKKTKSDVGRVASRNLAQFFWTLFHVTKKYCHPPLLPLHILKGFYFLHIICFTDFSCFLGFGKRRTPKAKEGESGCSRLKIHLRPGNCEAAGTYLHQ
jgi:hypothetical protein